MGEGIQRAHAVIDQIHLHPLRLFRDERIGETPAHLVIVEDIGFHIDMVFCIADGIEHRIESGRTVLQQQHLITHHQRTPDYHFFQGQMPFENIGVFVAALETVEDQPALLDGKRPRAPSS